jgi:hypothetical protein
MRNPSRAIIGIPTHHLNSTNFLGVRVCFVADINVAGMQVWLGTFDSPHEATRTYDAMSWRYARRRTDMNFPEIESREDAEMLALPPALTTP